jgi:hypothetical protein
VHPVPDPLLLGKYGGAGNRTRTSGSVARNVDQYTTEEVSICSCTFLKAVDLHETCLYDNSVLLSNNSLLRDRPIIYDVDSVSYKVGTVLD